jgi:hypothetical protein
MLVFSDLYNSDAAAVAPASVLIATIDIIVLEAKGIAGCVDPETGPIPGPVSTPDTRLWLFGLAWLAQSRC